MTELRKERRLPEGLGMAAQVSNDHAEADIFRNEPQNLVGGSGGLNRTAQPEDQKGNNG